MKKYLLLLVFVLCGTSHLLGQDQSESERSVAIATDGKYTCQLIKERDLYGLLSVSHLLKSSQGNLIESNFDSELRRLKKNTRKVRAEIQVLREKQKTARVLSKREQLKLIRLKISDIKLCRLQKSPYEFDVGLGPNVNSCDVASGNRNFIVKIINGEQCSRLNSPVVQLILKDFKGRSFICTGTVINSRSIITAAHCTEGIAEILIETNNESIKASSFYVHPSYDGTETHDVGVVNSRRDLGVHAFPVIADYQTFTLGENVIIAGFGVSEIGSENSSGKLLAGTNTLTKASSRRLSINFNTPDQSNTCFGDSGGPLLVYRNSRWVLAGVTANGLRNDCGYEDISNFANLVNPLNRSFVEERIIGTIE